MRNIQTKTFTFSTVSYENDFTDKVEIERKNGDEMN